MLKGSSGECHSSSGFHAGRISRPCNQQIRGKVRAEQGGDALKVDYNEGLNWFAVRDA